MPDPSLVVLPALTILYVDQPAVSAAFYAALLGRAPTEASPTFAIFALDTGGSLGLWSRHTVEPAAAHTGGGGEIAFPVADAATVHAVHAAWSRQGLVILQAPTTLDFGETFVALDPDRHRLRVFAPTAG